MDKIEASSQIKPHLLPAFDCKNKTKNIQEKSDF